jgi:hypothetical protein
VGVVVCFVLKSTAFPTPNTYLVPGVPILLTTIHLPQDLDSKGFSKVLGMWSLNRIKEGQRWSFKLSTMNGNHLKLFLSVILFVCSVSHIDGSSVCSEHPQYSILLPGQAIQTIQVPVHIRIFLDTDRPLEGKVASLTLAHSLSWVKGLNDVFNQYNISFHLCRTTKTQYFKPKINTTQFDVNWNYGINQTLPATTLQIIVVEGLGTYNETNQWVRFYGHTNFPWDLKKAPDAIKIEAASVECVDLIHEVGHWFGLVHTFDNECENEGDFVKDTELGKYVDLEGETVTCESLRQSTKSMRYRCPKQPASKASELSNPDYHPYPVYNYMSYVPLKCMTQFTKGQVRRMKAMYSWRLTGNGPPEDTVY